MVPLTARGQIERAVALGHTPSIERQAPDRLYFVCSCGYRSTRRRSENALRGMLSWHIGKVIGSAEINGGTPPPFFSPVPPGRSPDTDERGTAARTKQASNG